MNAPRFMPTLPKLSGRATGARSSIIREILKVTQRSEVISFAGGLPSPATFPVEALRAACDRVLQASGPAALQYSSTEGDDALRAWVAARETAHGIPTSDEQVLIVAGSQQGLDLIGKAFIDSGSTVLVESPTYLGALQAFALFDPRFRELPTDTEGLQPDAIDAELVRDARFAYVMPNFQNPTGRTLSRERRIALADQARALDLWLVEDDPYGELWYRHAPPPGLRHFAPERTIRLGSFSKVLAPGLRLGYLIAPPAMIDVLVRLKQATDLHTSTLAQRAAHEIVASGLLENHLPQIRARYSAQCEVMLDAMRAHFPQGIRWTQPDGGMFIWVELPGGVDTTQLLDAAIARKVAFVPGAPFYASAPRTNTLRLSFVTVPAERIRAGVDVLGELLTERLRERIPEGTSA
jgi:2-aminoadipate transaminase